MLAQLENLIMATYECKKCGMSVNATCGQCDTPLENVLAFLEVVRSQPGYS